MSERQNLTLGELCAAHLRKVLVFPIGKGDEVAGVLFDVTHEIRRRIDTPVHIRTEDRVERHTLPSVHPCVIEAEPFNPDDYELGPAIHLVEDTHG